MTVEKGAQKLSIRPIHRLF